MDKRVSGGFFSESGFSLIEGMVTGALLTFVAVAVISPAKNLILKSQSSSFRVACAGIVRSKIQDYVNGKGYAETYNGTSANEAHSGFEYTKKRYQYHTQYNGNGTKNGPCYLNPAAGAAGSAGQPGMREKIQDGTVVANNSALEAGAPQNLLGFQVWTSIKHVNPRVLSTGGKPSKACPSYLYEFLEVGDALEVTVTGMIRVRPTVANGGRGGVKYGDLDDLDNNTPNPQLSCSVTQIVYPQRIPFRYYLGKDGKIRTLQTTASSNAGTANYSSVQYQEAHYRHLWSQAPTTGTVSSGTYTNIKSFSIAPDNASAYILRNGELTQYTQCNDTNQNSLGTPTIDGVTFSGMPDCTLSTSTVWTVDPNISGITVNYNTLSSFTDDSVYVFYNTGSQTTLKMLTLPAGGGAATVGSPTGTFSLPASPRVKGIFLTQPFPAETSPQLFYFDNTCISGGSSTNDGTYCTTVFNSGDSSATMDVRELGSQVQAISY